ncbi:MAG: hypothetical protein CVV64_16445 [Candidatus Wallbacteria bacterium HGW-Wallbacteria-1]|jgi:competence protein ComGC|uniref:Uncharacterized protein n=1 Tax=Candidatus Wallbacteria bacterium HGW-Wallbacteria-1 TaxID=2013854 RepID=A0A2N1PKV7_9BACT|nr:MAG: hypothetical protein CVV64_16445 [Candidatus Wallbacteria bacterium HGW-Wallbacteria-1]
MKNQHQGLRRIKKNQHTASGGLSQWNQRHFRLALFIFLAVLCNFLATPFSFSAASGTAAPDSPTPSDRITYYIPFDDVGSLFTGSNSKSEKRRTDSDNRGLPSLRHDSMIFLPYSDLESLEKRILGIRKNIDELRGIRFGSQKESKVKLPQWTLDELLIKGHTGTLESRGLLDITVSATVTLNEYGLVTVPVIRGRLNLAKSDWDPSKVMMDMKYVREEVSSSEESGASSLPNTQYSILLWEKGTHKINLTLVATPLTVAGKSLFTFEPGIAARGEAQFVFPDDGMEGSFLQHIGIQKEKKGGLQTISSRLLPSGSMTFYFFSRKKTLEPTQAPGHSEGGQAAEIAGGTTSGEPVSAAAAASTPSTTGEGDKTSTVTEKAPSSEKATAIEKATVTGKAPVIRKVIPKIFSEVSTLLSIGDRIIQGVAVFDYQIRRASLSTIQVAFPEGLEILEVSCLDMETWALLPASAAAESSVPTEGDGNVADEANSGQPLPRRLSVSLNVPFKGDKRLVVVFERRIEGGGDGKSEKTGSAEMISVPTLSTLFCERELGYTGVEALTSVEVSEGNGNRGVRIDPSELPGHISGLARNPVIMAFRNSRGAWPLSLAIKRFRGAQVLSTYADKANLALIRIESGKTLTRMNLKIKNKGKQFLKLRLPEGTRILNTFVDGVPEKASRGEDGKIWIPLVQSDEDTPFPVQVVFEDSAGEAVPSFGRAGFTVPAADIPIGAMSLSLYLPENVTYTSFRGDMEQVSRDEEHILFMISRGVIRAAMAAMEWAVILAILLAFMALIAKIFLHIPFRSIGGVLSSAGTKVATSAFSFLTNVAAIFVVILVIALLAAISIPNFSKARKQARVKSCIANMRTLEGAIEMLDMDSSGTIPELTSTGFLCSSGKTGPLMELLISKRYLKSAPTCKGGGKYYNVVQDSSNFLACTAHGTVNEPTNGEAYVIPTGSSSSTGRNNVMAEARMDYDRMEESLGREMSKSRRRQSPKKKSEKPSSRSWKGAPSESESDFFASSAGSMPSPTPVKDGGSSRSDEGHGRAKGVLPVPVRIPGSSNVYHFTRIMIPAGQSLTLNSYFFGKTPLKGLYTLCGLAGFLLAMGLVGMMYWSEKKFIYGIMALIGIAGTLAAEHTIDSGLRFSTRAGLLIPILAIIGLKVFILAKHLPVFFDWLGRFKKNAMEKFFPSAMILLLAALLSSMIPMGQCLLSPAMALEENAVWVPYRTLSETKLLEGSGRMVFIPYSRFLSLRSEMERLQQSRDELVSINEKIRQNNLQSVECPFEYSLISMEHQGTSGPGAIRFRTQVRIFKSGAGMAEIPLISTIVAIVSCRIDGRDVTLNRSENSGMFHLMTDQRGQIDVELIYYVRTETFRSGFRVSFAHASVARELLILNPGPGDYNVDFPSAVLTHSTGDRASGRSLHFAVTPGNEITFNCEPRVTDPFSARSAVQGGMSGTGTLDFSGDGRSGTTVSGTRSQNSGTAISSTGNESGNLPQDRKEQVTTRETRKPKVFATVETIYRLSDSLLRASANINYNLRFGSVGIFEIEVPEDVEIVSVGDDDTLKWEIQKSRMTVYLPTPKRGSFNLPVKFERIVADNAEKIEIPVLRTVNTERENGHIGIEVRSSMEVRVDSSTNSMTIDPAKLPGSLRSLAEGPVVLAMKYTRQPFDLVLKVKKSEELPMVTAMIDTARFNSYLSGNGTLLTESVFNVRNNHEQFLKIRLPRNHSIWSVTVDGKTAKPGMVSDREAAIPIRKSVGQGDALTTFEVRIVTAHEGEVMGYIARRSLTLPEVLNIGITQLEWTVGLPETHRMISWDGDLNEASESPTGKFLNDETVYRVKDSSAGSRKNGNSGKNFSDMQRNRELIKGLNVPLPEGMDGEGLLSVKVRIPGSSRTHRFTAKLLDAGSRSPELRIVCGSNKLEKRVYGLTYAIGIGVCLLFWWGMRREGRRMFTSMIGIIIIGGVYFSQEYLIMSLDIFGLGLAMGVMGLVFYLLVKPWQLD